jgi:hypothetical protein
LFGDAMMIDGGCIEVTFLRVGIRLVGVFVILAALIVPASPAASATRGGWDGIGVVDAHDAPELARSAGAGWQRMRFFWNEIQPDNAQQWLADQVISDAEIARDLSAGMTIAGIIGNPPAWATRNGSVPRNLLAPLDDPDHHWARYVEKLARTYAGRVDHWIIWNEPDIDPGHPWSTWAGSEEEYYRLLKSAYLAIKRANPRATVVFGGTTFWFDYSKDRKLFLERILERAVLDPGAREAGYYFDAVSTHLYSSVESIEWVLAAYRDVLRRYGTSKPIWIGEANIVPHDDPFARVPRGGGRATLSEQAAYVIQAIAIARVAGIERIAIYKLVDGKIEGGEPFGLVRNDLSARPAFSAFQVAAKYLSSSGTVTDRNANGLRQITIDSPQRRVTVAWATGAEAKQISVIPIGTRNRLIYADGRETIPPFPGRDGELDWRFQLAGSTTNTVDNAPLLFNVGGQPVILVEEEFGQGIDITPDRRFYPATGQVVAGPFLNYFDRRGGLQTFGYPISRPFRLLGKDVQFFQRQVMELRGDGTVGTMNLLDDELMPYTTINGATFPGIDRDLIKTAPEPGSRGYDQGILEYVRKTSPDVWQSVSVRFLHTFMNTVQAATAFPSGTGSPGMLPGLNLELWGVPTSNPAPDPKNHDFVYQRFQRGIMHFDKRTGATQGLLLAEYLKAIITGENIPSDLAAQAAGSRFFRQYDRSGGQPVLRPDQLPETDLRNAFTRVPAR